ncbi:arylsulfatase [Novipirellula artificiosorum]|uniref:Arylsulfatase n=1 Tax=Novipirellula artificiosorum TaxID=2528016 RepID=A0A5C6D6S5_9BACT|nr:arylsulfatase [Novipirellula artificiosorum]TWU32893.1 Arylsulfatase [Novipirellula artificiosorum]
MKTLFRILACVFVLPCMVQAQSKPNVVYILADDLGLGDLSCYGQQKFQTPNIDRLAREGMKFSGHYSGNTVCSPSRAVLMTGQQPGAVAVRGNISESGDGLLDPTQTVLPEVFKASGYATGAYGKWGLGHTHESGPANPLWHGFDEFAGWKSQTIAHTYYPTSIVENGKEIKLDPGTYVHDRIMHRAMEFIQHHAKSKTPFFCYIPTAVPHAAMQAPKELHAKWRKVFPEFDDVIGKYTVHGGDGVETCEDVVNPIAGFAAMIENLDNQVGEILDLLNELQVDDNTLMIFTSDNGAHKEGGHDPDFWNSTANLRGFKRDMHEGGIRTPMLARWPGVIPAGQTTDHLSAFWDVLPTMCEILGQPRPDQSDGISFLPTLLGKPNQQRAHEYLYWEFCKGGDQIIFSQALRKGKWKAYREVAKNSQPALAPMEIYNLEIDPYETNDLARSMPELVTEMATLMKEAHSPLPTWTRK